MAPDSRSTWLRPAAVALTALVALAVILWGLAPQSSRLASALEADRGAGATPIASRAARDPSEGPASSPSRSAHERTGPRLILEIAGPEPGPVQGTVYWRSQDNPPLTASTMAPDCGYPLPADQGVHECAHEGTASLDVPAGHWIWLRATVVGPHGIHGTYARLPPFEGVQTVRLLLQPAEQRRIHVFALNPDLSGSEPGAEVSLYGMDLRQGGPPTLLERRPTDAHGYVCFDRLAPGGFLVCAPGASPSDQPPFVARIMLPKGMPPAELPLTLASPGLRGVVRLRTLTQGAAPGMPGALPPKLYLRRKGVFASQVLPVPGALTEAAQDLEVTLPVGEYEIGVLPLGALVCTGGTGNLRVEAGSQEHAVRLAGMARTVRVALRGLPAQELPAQVSLRPAVDLQTSHAATLFSGPYRWRTLAESIPAQDVPARVVVSGRRSTWCSPDVVRFEPETVVELVPASSLTVRWRAVDPRAPSTVELHNGPWRATLALAGELAAEGGDHVVALEAREIVPRGRLELVCRLPGGVTAWTADTLVDKPTVLVAVDGSRDHQVAITRK